MSIIGIFFRLRFFLLRLFFLFFRLGHRFSYRDRLLYRLYLCIKRKCLHRRDFLLRFFSCLFFARNITFCTAILLALSGRLGIPFLLFRLTVLRNIFVCFIPYGFFVLRRFLYRIIRYALRLFFRLSKRLLSFFVRKQLCTVKLVRTAQSKHVVRCVLMPEHDRLSVFCGDLRLLF